MATPHEERFIETAVGMKLIEHADAEKAAFAGGRIRERGGYGDVRTVLVGRRKIDPSDADQVLKEMGDIPMTCCICGALYVLPDFLPTMPCEKDQGPLEPVLAPDDAANVSPRPRSTTQRRKAEAQLDPMVGKTVGNFELTELLGKDTHTRTYLAELPNTEGNFTVKICTADKSDVRRRFLREAKYTRLIRHPNVANVLTSGETPTGEPFIAVDFASGDTLTQRLDDGPLPVSVAVHIARQLLSGLDAVHQMGVVHRNIKPGNLVLDYTDHVVLIGFGSARLQDDSMISAHLTAPGSSLGTPHYMAPEQVTSSKVGPPADIYAAGATIFHMLAGHPPFQGNNVVQIVQAKLTQDPPSAREANPAVPQILDHVVQSLLGRSPAERYPSAAHAMEALPSL